MFTDWLRKLTKGIVQPIARGLGNLGISPNLITILGCVLNILVAVVIASGKPQLGGILLVPAFVLDAFDGAVAREMNRVTKFGAFLDSCLDRVSESAVLLALAWWYIMADQHLPALLAAISIIGAMLVSYTRARAEGIGVECKAGFFTRVERGVLIIIGLITGIPQVMLWVMAVGTVATAAHRMIYVYLHSPKSTVS